MANSSRCLLSNFNFLFVIMNGTKLQLRQVHQKKSSYCVTNIYESGSYF